MRSSAARSMSKESSRRPSPRMSGCDGSSRNGPSRPALTGGDARRTGGAAAAAARASAWTSGIVLLPPPTKTGSDVVRRCLRPGVRGDGQFCGAPGAGNKRSPMSPSCGASSNDRSEPGRNMSPASSSTARNAAMSASVMGARLDAKGSLWCRRCDLDCCGGVPSESESEFSEVDMASGGRAGVGGGFAMDVGRRPAPLVVLDWCAGDGAAWVAVLRARSQKPSPQAVDCGDVAKSLCGRWLVASPRPRHAHGTPSAPRRRRPSNSPGKTRTGSFKTADRVRNDAG
mmetsp:Transcript_10784/g.33285  ORF Transcript_10784/g.33285 Transcript_10784/m.33285 type:complete len:286 (-) Transcript_10784:32-889(-)